MNLRIGHCSRQALAGLLLSVLLCACQSGPQIRSSGDTEADFSRYRTYGFVPTPSTDTSQYSTLLTQYLKTAIAREMNSRGYKPADEPDLLVNFFVLAKDKLQVTRAPSAYYGYRRGLYATSAAYETDVQQYTEGTLTVDLVDASRKQLVWTGTAVGRIREAALKDPQPAIDRVLPEIFAQFSHRAP